MAQRENFAQWHNRNLKRINAHLRTCLPAGKDNLAVAMRYATLGSGKRLRALLCLAVAADCGNTRNALATACAIELLHCYSLVHDDLPCMDDDQVRRGKPCCHVRFGEATALLVGDALQAQAFAILAATRLSNVAIGYLATAAGVHGMVQGQALDLANSANTLKQLQHMHALKTGALFVAAARLGAAVAGATAVQTRPWLAAAKTFGLLFQIANDVDDAISAGSDVAAGRCTYVSVLGLDTAQQHAQQIRCKLLSLLPEDSRCGELSNWTFARQSGVYT